MSRPMTRGGLWKLVIAIAIASTAIIIGAGLVNAGRSDAASHDHGSHDHPSDDHTGHSHASVLGDGGRFTGPGVTWPPEPKNATDIRVIDTSQPTQQSDSFAAGSARDRASAAAGAHQGNDFDVKHVDALAARDQLEIADAIPENDQPPLSDVEANEAVALARSWWLDDGNERVADLQGFAIRAFQANGDFFPERMVYVSFHVNNDAAPELLNLVDLTNGQVTSGWLDQ